MQRSDGSVVSGNTEDFLFTYSEEEKQKYEVNSTNASHVFSPKFIPLYPQLLKEGLTLTEALIFGFIDFYKSTSSNRFYFTNEQISQIVSCSPDTVSRCIIKLESGGYIKTSKKVRAGGGLIRFVTDISYNIEPTIYRFADRQKLQTNNNKINIQYINNNKSVIKTHTGKSYKDIGDVDNSDIEEIAIAYKTTREFVESSYMGLRLYCESKGAVYDNYRSALERFVVGDLKPKEKNAVEFNVGNLKKLEELRAKAVKGVL